MVPFIFWRCLRKRQRIFRRILFDALHHAYGLLHAAVNERDGHCSLIIFSQSNAIWTSSTTPSPPRLVDKSRYKFTRLFRRSDGRAGGRVELERRTGSGERRCPVQQLADYSASSRRRCTIHDECVKDVASRRVADDGIWRHFRRRRRCRVGRLR